MPSSATLTAQQSDAPASFPSCLTTILYWPPRPVPTLLRRVHGVHCITLLLAAAEQRESYRELRDAFNSVRQHDTPPIPPMEERLGSFNCDSFLCRLVDTVFLACFVPCGINGRTGAQLPTRRFAYSERIVVRVFCRYVCHVAYAFHNLLVLTRNL